MSFEQCSKRYGLNHAASIETHGRPMTSRLSGVAAKQLGHTANTRSKCRQRTSKSAALDPLIGHAAAHTGPASTPPALRPGILEPACAQRPNPRIPPWLSGDARLRRSRVVSGETAAYVLSET
eukprot:4073395-Prymnesium_polylepis.1